MDKHAHTAYGIDNVADFKPVIAIIRPDLIAGAYAFGAEGWKSYIQKVFI